MNKSASGPPPLPVEIPWSAWKTAPVEWSLYRLGRWMSSRGDNLDKLGQRLMAHAAERLEANGERGPDQES